MPEMTRIDGTINRIGETQQVGQKGFKKRELWLGLDLDSERPQFICLEATFEMIDVLDNFSEGEEVVAHYALGGRKWENPSGDPRCFNTLSLRKIQTLVDRDTYEDEAKSENSEEAENDLGDEMPF